MRFICLLMVVGFGLGACSKGDRTPPAEPAAQQPAQPAAPQPGPALATVASPQQAALAKLPVMPEAKPLEKERRQAYHIARSLGRIGKGYREVVEMLLETLGSESVDTRAAAAAALGQVRCPAELSAALVKATQDTSPKVAAFAKISLLTVRGDPDGKLLDQVIGLLDAKEGEIRQGSAWALGNGGAAAAAAVHKLIALAKGDPGVLVRTAATGALGRIGTPAAQILPVLRGFLKLGKGLPTDAALTALAAMGPSAKPAMADIRKLAKAKGMTGRLAKDALQKISAK